MKITRILVALSFLFAVSNVNAGELSVTGNMETTFQSQDGTTNGNPLGMDKELKFSASTELDNGISVSVMQDTSDSLTFGNSQIAFGNIVGLATIYVGTDSDPLDAIDDITPNAYEEANGSGSGTYVDIGGAAGEMGIGLKVTVPYLGALNAKHYPKIDGTKNADNKSSGDAADVGSAYSATLTTSFGELLPLLDGLVVTTGVGEREQTTKVDTEQNMDATVAVNYAYGPLKLGAQRKHTAIGTTVANTTAAAAESVRHNDLILGAAYAINDSLSVSYNRYESTRTDPTASTLADSNGIQETTAISIGYTVGGMVVGLQNASTDNAGYVVGANDDSNTLGLSIAF